MFTLICALFAVYLASNCGYKGYKATAYVVAFEFVAHKLSYWFLLLDFRDENRWAIFLIYAFIQVIAIGLIRLYKGHFFIAFLIFLNMIYNLSTALGWFYAEFIRFYAPKDVIIGIIMTVELAYLGALTRYVSICMRDKGFVDSAVVDRLFCVGWPNIFRRSLV